MGLFKDQFSNVIEWQEDREDVLFYKWNNDEIKKGSKLIIRPGQDAIFLYNGIIEGIFEDEGGFDIETQIIPFLSTLRGFKFGFNSGIRAEVLFINTKQFVVKWGTKNTLNIPTPGLPGGMPIRAFGTFSCKIQDYTVLIDNIAGIKQQFVVEDVRDRVIPMLDQLLMKWIAREGRDMFNLQADALDISNGIKQDLDMEMIKIGITITAFAVSSFSYPEEVQEMQKKAASQSMIGDLNRYQQMGMVDSMTQGRSSAGSVASDMAGLQMGMMMGQQMADQMQNQGNQAAPNQNYPKFCPNCGTPTSGANFCADCGNKLK